jgi:hypothetical protein
LTTKELNQKIISDNAYLSDPDWATKNEEGRRILSEIRDNTARGNMTGVAALRREFSDFIKSEIDNHTIDTVTPEEIYKTIEERNPFNYVAAKGCR